MENELVEELGEGVAIIEKQRNDAVNGPKNGYQCGVCGGVLKSGYGKPFCRRCKSDVTTLEDRFEVNRELPISLETAKEYFNRTNGDRE